jgi:hypothetical protein
MFVCRSAIRPASQRLRGVHNREWSFFVRANDLASSMRPMRDVPHAVTVSS